MDLVTTLLDEDKVRVHLALPGGGYSITDYAVADGPYDVAVGDVNADGRLDIVTVTPLGTGGRVSVLLAQPTGGYARTDLAVGGGSNALAIGDVNADGRVDIVTSSSLADSVTILLALAGGGYSRTDYIVGNSPQDVAIGDVNADGRMDIVTNNSDPNQGYLLNVMLAQANGGYIVVDYPAIDFPISIALADVNGDSRTDIVTANYTGLSISVFRALAGGGFTRTDYGVGSTPVSVAVRDVNSDGRLDIVTANLGATNVTVLLASTGPGGYSRSDYAVAGAPNSVAVADVNGDGRLDVVTANNTNNLTLLLNSTPVAITRQPGFGSTVCPGSNVSTSVSAEGLGLRYQWYKDGSLVTSQTSATLTLTNVQNADAGDYVAVVTGCRSVTSTLFSLVVNPQPSQFTVTGGGTYCSGGAGVAVSLPSSQTGVNYQLLRNGSVIGGQVKTGTGNAISFDNQTVAGIYTIVARNLNTGCQQTMTGSVSVSIAPYPDSRFTRLASAYCSSDAPVALTAITTGGTFTGPGVSGSTFNPANAGTGGQVSYAVTVNGCTASSSQNVVVNTQPIPDLTNDGPLSCMKISVLLTASGGNTYRFSDGANQQGDNTGTTATVTSAGVYSVTATSAAGCWATASSTVTTSGDLPLTFISQPASATSVPVGATVETSGAVSGPAIYQWYKDGLVVSGQTSATLSLTDVQLSQAGSYSLVATNACNSVSSTAFGLTVIASDLTPVLYARPTVLNGNALMTVVVDVFEVGGVPSTGPIRLKISQDSKLSLSLPSSATSVGGRPVNNSVWQLSGPQGGYYTLTTSQTVEADKLLSVGLEGLFQPGATSGKLVVSATLLMDNEQQMDNNSDADKIDYFQQ
ncbi:hypothetical protein GCM10028773_16730 [Spirosoma koreense]